MSILRFLQKVQERKAIKRKICCTERLGTTVNRTTEQNLWIESKQRSQQRMIE